MTISLTQGWEKKLTPLKLLTIIPTTAGLKTSMNLDYLCYYI